MRILLVSLVNVLLSGVLYASDVVFPHLASGPHYVTELKMTNLETSAATVSLSFFRPDGQTSDAFFDSSGALQLPPQGTAVVRLKRGPEDVAGWARAQSSATITGVLQITYLPGSGVSSAVSFDSLNLVSAARINGASNDLSRKTAIAVCNPGPAALSVELELFGSGGESFGRVPWSVPAGNQRALYLEELGIPGAHSVEIVSKSGLFSAISVWQNAAEMSANQVSELIQKRFVMQQERVSLNFSAYQVRSRGNIAVITGNNGVNFLDLSRRIIMATLPLDLLQFWENIAFHPWRPLVAVAGKNETLIVDTNTFSVVKRLQLGNGTVAFDDLTGTLLTTSYLGFGIAPPGSKVTSYDQNFEPTAVRATTYEPGLPHARNGQLVLVRGRSFLILRVPSLETIAETSLPGEATTYWQRLSGDNIAVFGPDTPESTRAANLLSLYYIDSGRLETIPLGEPVDTKVVQKERVYLTRENRLKVVDLLQRRVIQSSVLSFAPRAMDFYVEANALLALEPNAVWILRLAAQ